MSSETVDTVQGNLRVQSSPTPPAPHAGTPVLVGGFDSAITIAAIAIANADRILRGQPPVVLALDLHPAVLENCRAAALQAVVEQHNAARLEAYNDAGEELREFADRLTSDPDHIEMAADPVMLKDASVAMVKKILLVYRAGLAGQLPILRCVDQPES